jgi:hypothetical protein
MTGLRLAKLPDRTPIKVSISLPPELHERLTHYLSVYRATYGDLSVGISDLIPAMLANFIDNDRAFAKARKPSPPIA